MQQQGQTKETLLRLTEALQQEIIKLQEFYRTVAIPGDNSSTLPHPAQPSITSFFAPTMTWPTATPSFAKPPQTTLVQKRGPQVDSTCSLTGVHIYRDPLTRQYWTCMLNQTNIRANNNKFFVFNLIESDNEPRQYWCFYRWGRGTKRPSPSTTEFNSHL